MRVVTFHQCIAGTQNSAWNINEDTIWQCAAVIGAKSQTQLRTWTKIWLVLWVDILLSEWFILKPIKLVSNKLIRWTGMWDRYGGTSPRNAFQKGCCTGKSVSRWPFAVSHFRNCHDTGCTWLRQPFLGSPSIGIQRHSSFIPVGPTLSCLSSGARGQQRLSLRAGSKCHSPVLTSASFLLLTGVDPISLLEEQSAHTLHLSISNPLPWEPNL